MFGKSLIITILLVFHLTIIASRQHCHNTELCGNHVKPINSIYQTG